LRLYGESKTRNIDAGLATTMETASGVPFDIFSVVHQGERTLAVSCLREKHVLAQHAANLMTSVLDIGMSSVDMAVRFEHDQWESLKAQLAGHSDFSQVAIVSDGPFVGLVAIGVGSNKLRLKRGACLALMLSAVCRAPSLNVSSLLQRCGCHEFEALGKLCSLAHRILAVVASNSKIEYKEHRKITHTNL
jgi:hypothetical protein